ncbi:MAG: hypothetical protein NVS9B15_01790 [Acidobacteriaceae bacterium]
MKAVVITRFGGPEVLELREVATPSVAGEDILVRVRATALNRADLLQRRGRYPAPQGVSADFPGLEFAGEISALGEPCGNWKVGQRVFGIIGGGSFAEYVSIHKDLLVEIPSNLDWIHAAATPEAFITAHDALYVQAGLRPGEAVLINAVASGVGLAATQLARALNASVYGTARSASKLDVARSYGLDDGWVIESAARASASQ